MQLIHIRQKLPMVSGSPALPPCSSKTTCFEKLIKYDKLPHFPPYYWLLSCVLWCASSYRHCLFPFFPSQIFLRSLAQAKNSETGLNILFPHFIKRDGWHHLFLITSQQRLCSVGIGEVQSNGWMFLCSLSPVCPPYITASQRANDQLAYCIPFKHWWSEGTLVCFKCCISGLYFTA